MRIYLNLEYQVGEPIHAGYMFILYLLKVIQDFKYGLGSYYVPKDYPLQSFNLIFRRDRYLLPQFLYQQCLKCVTEEVLRLVRIG